MKDQWSINYNRIIYHKDAWILSNKKNSLTDPKQKNTSYSEEILKFYHCARSRSQILKN